MVRKRNKDIGPKNNIKSITYMIFDYLKKGVSSREELICKLHKHFKDNNIIENAKERKISLKAVMNNTNEVIRYINEEKNGWYSKFELQKKDGLKLVERSNENGNKNDTIFERIRKKKIQDRKKDDSNRND